MRSTQKRRVFCRREDWMNGLHSQLELRGDTIVLDTQQHTAGFLCLPAVDSAVTGFSWRRVQVHCHLPQDSSLRVFARASDTKYLGQWTDLDAGLAGLQGSFRELYRTLGEIFGEPVSRSGDFLVNQQGRYLWLMVELMGAGSEAPSIDSISVWMEGDHMTDYLPACYRGDDFTWRFLSVFNSMFLDMEERIGQIPELLDVRNTGEEMLRQLASWVCLDSGGTAEELRAWIPTALEDYEWLYTVKGVQHSVERLTGRTPIIIEHHDVDPNSPDCINPVLYRRLYGEDPFRFFVLLQENTFPVRKELEDFLEKMRRLIPAGTEMELILLKHCVQLDWHTYLGINTVVGDYIPVAINENMTIHFDTVIGG